MDHRHKYLEIILSGEAETTLPAERAVLSIEVSTREADIKLAARDVLFTSRRVETLLSQLAPQATTAAARHEAPIDYWSRTGLTETTSNAPPHLHTATVEFEARFQHFPALSSLLTDLAHVSSTLVTTKPVRWILLEPTKDSHRAALRAQAATEARGKARDYARALGCGTVTPHQLRESYAGADSSRMKGGKMPSDPTERTAKNLAEILGCSEVSSVGAFEFQPDDMKIRVVVEAIFHATI